MVLTWYKGSDGEMKTLELESVDYYMAVRANGGVDLSTEEKQIHTNAAGETYGEALVVKYLNEDVDMISAIGKNGTEGYIKVSDLPQNIPDYVPHDHEIPVYASDGVTVIDSLFHFLGIYRYGRIIMNRLQGENGVGLVNGSEDEK